LIKAKEIAEKNPQKLDKIRKFRIIGELRKNLWGMPIKSLINIKPEK